MSLVAFNRWRKGSDLPGICFLKAKNKGAFRDIMRLMAPQKERSV